jgi:flagellar hook-basal body complex protein FliE
MAKNYTSTTEQNQKQFNGAVEKIVADQTARLEAAVAEVSKLQSKASAQVNLFVEGATRVAHEQVAFAEQMTGEWRKLVLAATRSAADLFAHKA